MSHGRDNSEKSSQPNEKYLSQLLEKSKIMRLQARQQSSQRLRPPVTSSHALLIQQYRGHAQNKNRLQRLQSARRLCIDSFDKREMNDDRQARR